MEPEGKPSSKSKIFKFVIIIAVVIGFFAIILMLTTSSPKTVYTKKEKKEEEKAVVMTVTGNNKTQTYNTFIVDEWNGYRFKYRSDWTIKKQYDEKGSLAGITAYPQNKKSENEFIAIGNKQNNCEDYKMVKCLIGGYGIIMLPIYTYSSEEDITNVYEALTKSIIGFQGSTKSDIEKIRKTISIFVTAQKENKFSTAKEVLSANFLNNYDAKKFNLAREGSIGRYEFIENSKYLDNDYYQVPARVYAYFNEEKNEIGYWDYTFKIKFINGKYLIDDITINNFQAK